MSASRKKLLQPVETELAGMHAGKNRKQN